MLLFGDQLAVILASIFGRGTFSVLAKETAKVVTVRKSAACSDIFDFKLVAFKKLTRVLEACLRKIFVEPHAACFLKKMRKVVR